MLLTKRRQKYAVPTFGTPKPPPVDHPFNATSKPKKERQGERERTDKSSVPMLHSDIGTHRNQSGSTIKLRSVETVNENEKEEQLDQDTLELKEKMRAKLNGMDPAFVKQLLELFEIK